MHRSLLALTALAFIASCNEEDPAALFADLSYQLRCLDCTPIAPDAPKRDFSVVNGEDGTTLSCSTSGGRVSLEVIGEDFQFKMLDVLPGDDPGNQCEIRVREGGNEYRGGCKKVGGSGSNACEVELTGGGDSFSGTVECHNIKHMSNATLQRHVVAPGTTDEAAQVAVEGCL